MKLPSWWPKWLGGGSAAKAVPNSTVRTTTDLPGFRAGTSLALREDGRFWTEDGDYWVDADAALASPDFEAVEL